jgi:transposase
MQYFYTLDKYIASVMSLEMFTTCDIAKATISSCDKDEQMRLQALLLVKNGLSPSKVAEDFSVYRSTVYRWIERAEKEGLLSLKCKPGRGVKAFLTAEQFSELKEALSEPIPTGDGYYRDWQTKDAVQFVKEEFKISYSESRIRQIIKDMGFKKITTGTKSKKPNEMITNEFTDEIQKISKSKLPVRQT